MGAGEPNAYIGPDEVAQWLQSAASSDVRLVLSGLASARPLLFEKFLHERAADGAETLSTSKLPLSHSKSLASLVAEESDDADEPDELRAAVEVEDLSDRLATATTRIRLLSDEDGATVLNQVKSRKLGFDAGFDGTHPGLLLTPMNDLVESHKKFHPDGEYQQPVVQFAAFIFYCQETDGTIELDIMRIGDLSRRSAVRWRTVDASAKGGVDYVEKNGQVVFEPGELEKTVAVNLIVDEGWESTQEFNVQLLEDDRENAMLGRYLSRVRVKIVDSDWFPTNRATSGDSGTLFFEYVKFNWAHPEIRRRSVKTLLVDFIESVLGFVQLLLDVYLIDFVLVGDTSVLEPDLALASIVAFAILNFVIVRLLGYRRTQFFSIGGPSRFVLQDALFRKYLEVDYGHRLEQKAVDVQNVLTHDAMDLVSGGYGNFLSIWKEVENLFFYLLFQLIGPQIFPSKHANEAITMPVIAIVVFPVIFYLFLRCRRDITMHFQADRFGAYKALNDLVETMVTNYRLISDYHRRPQFMDEFEAAIRKHNKEIVTTGLVIFNNCSFPILATVLLKCIWVFVGGKWVLSNVLSIGFYITNTRVLVDIGKAMSKIYSIWMEIQHVYPALHRIQTFMNFPTELPKKKNLSEHYRRQTHELHALLLKENDSTISHELPFVDRMPIRVTNLHFSYKTKSASSVRTNDFVFDGMLEIFQGEMVALAGPRCGGKSTLLRILGGELFQCEDAFERTGDNEGALFMPAHLRILRVSKPMFVTGTLMENLTFGIHDGTNDGDSDRVLSICKRLKVDEDLLAIMSEVHPWQTVLSETQSHLINLARAFVANPEILVLHRPCLAFSRSTAEHIMNIFRTFVHDRGLSLMVGDTFHRRPRTVIFSTTSVDEMRHADRIYRVTRGGGIMRLKMMGSELESTFSLRTLGVASTQVVPRAAALAECVESVSTDTQEDENLKMSL